jgi:nucleotide-binding universal stress UspA family protein
MTNSFRKILVATDGSEGSLKAARTAISMAAQNRGELLAAHVVDDEIVKEFCRTINKEEREARKTLSANASKYIAEIERLAAQSSVPVRGIIEHGTPHEEILKLAEKEAVDLVVMGKTGRRGARRVFAGSVTRRVIDLANIPVLVVK